MKTDPVMDDFSRAGIAAEYINAHGKPQAIPTLTRQRLLAVMQPSHPLSTPLPPVKRVKSAQVAASPLSRCICRRCQKAIIS